MPKFSQADDAFFKKTMLPRAPSCFFTPEDVDLITKETEMDKSVIFQWATKLRFRMDNSLLGDGVASVEDFLQASAESLAEKVKFRVDVLAFLAKLLKLFHHLA